MTSRRMPEVAHTPTVQLAAQVLHWLERISGTLLAVPLRFAVATVL